MSINDDTVLARLRQARKKKGDKAEPEPNKPGDKKAYPKKIGRSEKMKGIMQAIKPLYEVFLEERTICEIKSPDCTGQATAIHHTEGRGITKIMDQRTWMACCSACNDWVESNDGEAQEIGAKKSRHKKTQ